jgi:signal peptidase I
VADPLRSLDRTRRDALRFAADARALAGRGRRKLAKEVRARIGAAAVEVEAAAADADQARLSASLRALDALWDEHLVDLGKPAWRSYAEAIVAAVLLALVVRVLAAEGYRISSGSMAPTLVPGDHVLVSRLAYGIRVPFTGTRLLGSAQPGRGDVVVFESPREPGRDVVKRVVGIPGDVIELRDEVLYVNRVPQPRTPQGVLAWEEAAEGDGAPFSGDCRRYREALARGTLVAPGRAGRTELDAWHSGAAAGVSSHEIIQCATERIAPREGPYEVVAPGHVFVLGDNRDRSADSRGGGGWQVPVESVAGKAVLVLFSRGTGGARQRAGGVPRLERLFKPVE